MNSDLSVVMFVFRRPELTARVFAEVRRARPAQLFLIADGARPGNSAEERAVRETRLVVDSVDWECEVFRVYADTNLGLRERVLSGLDFVFSKVEAAIILEDDCLPSPSFFSFSQDLLKRYKNELRVGAISGNFFGSKFPSSSSYEFDYDALIWGWATWRRTWLDFRKSLVSLREGDTENLALDIRESFSTWHRFRQFKSAIRIAPRLDSWALYFAAYIRKNKLLIARPRLNLVENIGFGVDSTHTHFEAFDVHLKAQDLPMPLNHPEGLIATRALERIEERTKLSRWIVFPLTHPIDFARRATKFLALRATKAMSSNKPLRNRRD